MISQTSRYALHLLGVLCARRGERVGGKELSQLTGIPENYLSKILNQLTKQGIVNSQKGWGGGFQLRERAMDQPISAVLGIFEGHEKTEPCDCVFGLPHCDTDNPCPLHNDWETIRNTYTNMITTTKISDLSFTGR